MTIKNLAKSILPFNIRRRLRFYQNKFSALRHMFIDIRYRSDDQLQPIPPPKLRFRVHGDMNLVHFVGVGRQCAKDVQKTMQVAGVPIDSLDSILDFGCGCGRTLNWLSKECPTVRYFGTDIDGESIDWCRKNYPKIEFQQNNISPPLSFSSNAFDLVYAISVFSHLNEESHLEWIRELCRVLKPGGYLLLSFHGEKSQSTLTEQERDAVASNGFLFKVDGLGKYKLDGLPDVYQTAYISDEYINKNWTEYLSVERIDEEAMNAHQSVVLMRKSGVPLK